MSKICSKCKEMKSKSEFTKNSSKSDGLHSSCRPCKRKAQNQWYKSHAKEQYTRIKEKRIETREWIRKQKNSPCVDCGNSYPYYVMDFDHLGDKKFSIGAAFSKSLENIKLEIGKCELVCANCHRIRTHTRASNSTVE